MVCPSPNTEFPTPLFVMMQLLLVVLFCNIATPAVSDKVLRVVPSTTSQLRFITTLDYIVNKIDFWRLPSTVGQPVDLHVTDEDYHLLDSLLRDWGFDVIVQIPNVKRVIDAQRKESIKKRQVRPYGARMADFYDDYHPLHEINNELHSIAGRYRKLTTIFNMGKSYENRSIIAIQIQGKYKANKPLFFIQCGIHAREWISPATCMYVINKLASLYNKNFLVTAALDKMNVIVVPVFNVDGYEYTWTKNRLWRKNRRPEKNSSCIGVDLNRNWGNAWGGSGSSCDPCKGSYRGTKPFSEPETSSVKTFLESLGSRLYGFLDVHSYSQMWFIPWGHTKNKTKDYQEQMRVAELACRAMNESGIPVNYTHGQSSRLMYSASGIAQDWVYGNLKVRYSFSVELRDTGHYGFLLPASFIRQSGAETFKAINALIMAMKL